MNMHWIRGMFAPCHVNIASEQDSNRSIMYAGIFYEHSTRSIAFEIYFKLKSWSLFFFASFEGVKCISSTVRHIQSKKTWAVYFRKSRVVQLLLHLIECIAHKEIRHKARAVPSLESARSKSGAFLRGGSPKAPNGDWSLWNRARRTSVPEIWVPRGIKYARLTIRKASDFARIEIARDRFHCRIVTGRDQRELISSRLIARV